MAPRPAQIAPPNNAQHALVQPALEPSCSRLFSTCPGHIQILSMNCRSIRNKLSELESITTLHHPDVVCLTETWLRLWDTCQIPGYTVVRRDRPPTENRSGSAQGYGGVAILARECRFDKIIYREDLSRSGCEMVWVELSHRASQRQPILVLSCYRPPSQSSLELTAFCDSLQDCLQNIKLDRTRVFLTGDFNAHHVHWCARSTNNPGASLKRLFNCYGLTQMVHFPTLVASDMTAYDCLDLFVTNYPEGVRAIDSAPPLGASDHLQIVTGVDLMLTHSPVQDGQVHSTSSSSSTLPFFDFNFKSATTTQWLAVNDALSHQSWALLNNTDDVNTALAHFHAILYDTLAQYIPTTCPNRSTTRGKVQGASVPWLTQEVRQAVKVKQDAYSVYKKYPTPANLEKYK